MPLKTVSAIATVMIVQDNNWKGAFYDDVCPFMLLHNAKFMERSRHSVDVNTIYTELESSKKLEVLMLDLRLLSWGAFSSIERHNDMFECFDSLFQVYVKT